MHNTQFHISRDRSDLGRTEFEMSYSLHDYVYNHSKSHGDLLKKGPNFLGPKGKNKTGLYLVHIIKNSLLIRLPRVHTG